MNRDVSILLVVLSLLMAGVFGVDYDAVNAQTPLPSASPSVSPSPTTGAKPTLECEGCHGTGKTLPYLGGSLFHTTPHAAYDRGFHARVFLELLYFVGVID